MNRLQICEFLVNKTIPGELMKFRDEGDQGCVVIAANGMKFRYTVEQLAAAEPKIEANKPKPTTRRKPAKRKAASKK